MQISQRCIVPLSIGRPYKGTITCDIVEMDGTRILLDWPWQFDVDAVHRGRLNQYVIKVFDGHVALIPLPPEYKQEVGRSPIFWFNNVLCLSRN